MGQDQFKTVRFIRLKIFFKFKEPFFFFSENAVEEDEEIDS